MSTYKLNVTQDDIDKGARGSSSCAVARRVYADFEPMLPPGTKLGVQIGRTTARVMARDEDYKLLVSVDIDLPSQVTQLIDVFDDVVQWDGPDIGERPAPPPEVELELRMTLLP